VVDKVDPDAALSCTGGLGHRPIRDISEFADKTSGAKSIDLGVGK